jgi:hypothetical protein
MVLVGLLCAAMAGAQHPSQTDAQKSQASEMNQEAKTQATSTLSSESGSLSVKIDTRSIGWKIRNAMSGGPASIAKGATILDWGDRERGQMKELRKGANHWTCLPDDPTTPANDPCCIDRMAMQWAKARMSHGTPNLASPGIGYMLQGGGSPSNTDPFAKEPAAGDKWMNEPPHLMVFPASGTKLDPTAYGGRHSGGPWIMWPGTPYEHLIVPVK